MTGGILLRVALMLAFVCMGVHAAPPPEKPEAVMSIGVSPFVDRQGAVDGAVSLGLAKSLAANRDIRVVFPEELEALAVEDPEAREVRRWAERREVGVVVVGQETARGKGAKIEVEVRSGHSGATVERYAVMVDDEQSAPGQVAALAPRILRDLGHAPVSGSESAASPEPSPDPAAAMFALGKKGKPVAIESDELEVTQDAGARHIVFTGNVRVKQGTVTLMADRLDAFYEKGSSRPEYLEATGSVRVQDGNKKARCDNAVYHNTERTVLCKGKAELLQGCDRVRGAEIEFDLEEERVRVLGAASVVLQGDKKSSKCKGGFR